MEIENKCCSYCKQEKTIDLFSKNKSKKDGLSSECKICRKLMAAKYYKENTNKINDRDRRWRRNNQEKYRLSIMSAARKIRHKFLQGKNRAKRRGLVWTLTLFEYSGIIQKNECYYCSGVLPETGYALDRKNNNLGYTLNNVVPCCYSCNWSKNKRSEEEFKNWITSVFANFSRRQNGTIKD